MKVTIIGSGPAGLYAALVAQRNGAKVTLVEKSERLGGTCVLYGCIPSKAMLAPLGLAYSLNRLGREVKFTFQELRSLSMSTVDRVSKAVSLTLESAGIDVVHGNAELRSSKVHVGGEQIPSDAVIVATGTRKPDIKYTVASDDLPYYETDFNKVVLIGGGVGGVEYGWLLRMAGKEVTIVEKDSLLLPGHDQDLRTSVTSYFRRMGVNLMLNSIAKLENGSVTVNGEKLDADLVVMTFGRKFETFGFDELTSEGKIEVDEFMRTKVNGIYAAGDVTGSYTAHEAIHKGFVAGINATGGRKKYEGNAIPKVIYTEPQIAYVGRTEGICRKTNMTEIVRAVAEKRTEGFVKICRDEQGRITGGVAFSERGEEIITFVSTLMRIGVKVSDAIDVVLPHPSYLEAVWETLLRLQP